jgi:hypothetical protein
MRDYPKEPAARPPALPGEDRRFEKNERHCALACLHRRALAARPGQAFAKLRQFAVPARCLVGQVGNLRRIGNPPAATCAIGLLGLLEWAFGRAIVAAGHGPLWRTHSCFLLRRLCETAAGWHGPAVFRPSRRRMPHQFPRKSRSLQRASFASISGRSNLVV